MKPEALAALLALVSLVFGAGIAWGISQVQAREARKQINGLGNLVRRQKDAIILLTPKEQEKDVMWILGGGGGQT